VVTTPSAENDVSKSPGAADATRPAASTANTTVKVPRVRLPHMPNQPSGHPLPALGAPKILS